MTKYIASLVLSAALLGLVYAIPPEAQAASPPNVLLIVTDDQRANGTLSAMPEVRRLRNEGADFRRAYATTPFCCPSRGSIVTGLYTHNHGVLTVKPTKSSTTP